MLRVISTNGRLAGPQVSRAIALHLGQISGSATAAYLQKATLLSSLIDINKALYYHCSDTGPVCTTDYQLSFRSANTKSEQENDRRTRPKET